MNYKIIFLCLLLLILVTYPIIKNNILAPTFSVQIDGKNTKELKLMTYNIRHGRGLDHKVDLKRIGQLINDSQADLVGLNEVDIRHIRSGMTNQIKDLAKLTEMESYFGPTLSYGIGQYGNGLLTRLPIINLETDKLPHFNTNEDRGIIRLTTLLNERKVQILVTHLGLNPVERERQLDYLYQKIREIEDPLVLMGDFNTHWTADVMENFIEKTGLKMHSTASTFPSQEPEMKLDYILTSEEWKVVEEVTPIESKASDHIPLTATFRLEK